MERIVKHVPAETAYENKRYCLRGPCWGFIRKTVGATKSVLYWSLWRKDSVGRGPPFREGEESPLWKPTEKPSFGFKVFRPSLGPTQHPIQWEFFWSKWPGRETHGTSQIYGSMTLFPILLTALCRRTAVILTSNGKQCLSRVNSRQHHKQSGNVFSEDNRCWYISYLFNVSLNLATCFDL
jgi:hypothetical protein